MGSRIGKSNFYSGKKTSTFGFFGMFQFLGVFCIFHIIYGPKGKIFTDLGSELRYMLYTFPYFVPETVQKSTCF